jgi:hypothetical protein
MPSESARVTSAAEARFRIAAPNSQPRVVKVVALDRPSEALVQRLSQRTWSRALFFTAASFGAVPAAGAPFSMQTWLKDIAGRTHDLMQEVKSADLVVMIATAGEKAEAASLIGDACRLSGVMTTALILGSASQPDAVLSRSLALLRPHAVMLVIASAEEYIDDMLTALRA